MGAEPMMVLVRCEPKRHYAEMHPAFLCQVCHSPTCGEPGTYQAALSPESREARLMEAGLAAVRYTKAFDRWQVCVTPGGEVEREYRAAELAAERAARAVDPRAPDGEKEQE